MSLPPASGFEPTRRESRAGRFIRLGFDDISRAEKLVADLASAGVDVDTVLPLCGQAANPDQALLAVLRFAEVPGGVQRLRDMAGPASGDALAELVAVCGASSVLGDEIIRHPDMVDVLGCTDGGEAGDAAAGGDAMGAGRLTVSADNVRARLLSAVGAKPDADVPVASDAIRSVDDVRIAYYRRLIEIAAADLTAAHPADVFALVSGALADLAAAVLEAALAIARAQMPHHELARLAVVAMGKCAGRELNYISDVDVIYVGGPVGEGDEAAALAVATSLASALQKVCTVTSHEPPIWQVDPNLRPEGKNGPLVRTLASHEAYYKRWAEMWEYQALLKARAVAGDRELGEGFVSMTRPIVWSSDERGGFVAAAQAMRHRVEEHIPAAEADREIKLGIGGLRDVEFSVQMLQLVHGRYDDTIHHRNTLEALDALAAGGYVGRHDAERLAACYRWLRVIEHRVQLSRLRRTHLLPQSEAEQRCLARAAKLDPPVADEVGKQWREVRHEVRALHEELYYRPLLPMAASLTADEARLSPEAAVARLEALGYHDPQGAMRHIAALTEGVSRTAAIQRQLLPVMLGWFAQAADPDAGLLSFRKVSDDLGSTHWYLGMLRDSAGAAKRLCQVLAGSRYVAEGVLRSPEVIQWLDGDDDLRPRSFEQLLGEADALLTRQDEATTAIRLIRAMRQRELLRVAASWMVGVIGDDERLAAISRVARTAITSALRIAEQVVAKDRGRVEARMLIVGMGSFGGREMGFGSDADVLYVHEALPGVGEAEASQAAIEIAGKVHALLGEMGPEPSLELDADLRPEGRNGPLSRSLDAYKEYYENWALTWEKQALLRARPVAGDDALAARFIALIDPIRYNLAGLPHAELLELRKLKARIESERMPRGVEPKRHLKLGPGGLLDVQWVAQLLQMLHAGACPELRVTNTIAALEAARQTELITGEDAETLEEAWRAASNIRDANIVWTGRVDASADALPTNIRIGEGVSRVLRQPPGQGAQLEENYLRASRRARAVFERLYFGRE